MEVKPGGFKGFEGTASRPKSCPTLLSKVPGVGDGIDTVDQREAQGWNCCFDNTYSLKSMIIGKRKEDQ